MKRTMESYQASFGCHLSAWRALKVRKAIWGRQHSPSQPLWAPTVLWAPPSAPCPAHPSPRPCRTAVWAARAGPAVGPGTRALGKLGLPRQEMTAHQQRCEVAHCLGARAEFSCQLPPKQPVSPEGPHYLGAAKSPRRELSWYQVSTLAFLLWFHATEQVHHSAIVPNLRVL